MGTVIAGYTTSSDSLLRFRTGYLRAISKAWKCPNFLKSLTTTDNIIELPQFLDLMPGKKRLPWTAKININLDEKNGPRWSPGVTAGWFGPNDKIEIMLPEAPKNSEDYNDAITQYFQKFPTLLGKKFTASKRNNLNCKTDQTPPESNDDTKIITDNTSTDADGSSLEFINFSNCIIQGIVLSWVNMDPLGDPYSGLRDDMLEHGLSALTRFTGANNPWNFDIKFITNPCELGWDDTKKCWGELYNKITVNFPLSPEKTMDKEHAKFMEPIALAVYNSSGAHYPFTCP